MKPINEIDKARTALMVAVQGHTGNATFTRYIESELAGDFAVELAAMLAAPVAADAAAPTLPGSPAEGHWGEPETPSDGHKLESDVDEETQPDERAAFGAAFEAMKGTWQHMTPFEVFRAGWQARATAPQATVKGEGSLLPITGDRQPYQWRDSGPLETGDA